MSSMTFHRLASCLLLCSLSLLATPLRASDVITHISPESDRDLRTLYFRDLLQLALEKTRDSFGDYELRTAPPMNRIRMRQIVQTQQYPNLFVADSLRPAAESEALDYVRFPVELGILGYRICFVSPQQADAVARVNTLNDLQQFLHGQGRGWQDAEILRHGSFKVQEIDGYERLFKLVARAASISSAAVPTSSLSSRSSTVICPVSLWIGEWRCTIPSSTSSTPTRIIRPPSAASRLASSWRGGMARCNSSGCATSNLPSSSAAPQAPAVRVGQSAP